MPLDEETRYHLLKTLEASPELTQRQLARALGLSLGKTHYCLQALITKGWVKARNFKNSRKKRAYAYFLTPQGMREKARVTRRFLEHKQAEYEALAREIEQLRDEVTEPSQGGTSDQGRSGE